MRRSRTFGRTTMSPRKLAAIASLAAALIVHDAAGAEARRVPDSFTAKTANMSPAGITVRIDVLAWPDEQARASVIEAMTAADDVQGALVELPTVGYVWQGDSAVGYSIKYAHRAPTGDGGERVTVVTDRPVGSYEYEPWTAGTQPADAREYSVIEIYLDGERGGAGTTSLAPGAEVTFDEASRTIGLETDESAAALLTEAARVPKPYWVEEG